MGPKRKKSPNSTKASNITGTETKGAQTIQDTCDGSDQAANGVIGSGSAVQPALTAPAPGRSSWYGSWRAKATPVAEIAKESVSVAKGATSEASNAARRPSNSVSKSVKGGSRKSIPLAAEPTHVHATYGVARPRLPSTEKLQDASVSKSPKIEQTNERDASQLATSQPIESDIQGASETSPRPQPTSWLGWWSRPDGYGSDGEKRSKKPKLDDRKSKTDQPILQATEPIKDPGSEDGQVKDSDPVSAGKPSAQNEADNGTKTTSSRTWFGLWSSTQNQQCATQQSDPAATSEVTVAVKTSSAHVSSQPEIDMGESTPKEGRSHAPKSSAWAFWSSDRGKDDIGTPGGTQKHVGELAVAGTPSQTHPEAAQFNEQFEGSNPPKSPTTQSRRGRGGAGSKVSPRLKSVDQSSLAPPVLTSPEAIRETIEDLKPTTRQNNSPLRPNLLLPSFSDTFPPVSNPGYMERLTQYLAQSLHLPGSQALPRTQHVFASSSRHPIKKAVALGIHGYFPGPLFQKVLGQPTGTSIRFSTHAAACIKAWCQQHQPNSNEVEIEKVALEGEGYIGDRVDTLWKLLLNWLKDLRQADFVFVSCHSQGVPVAMMLLAKLISFGCLDSHVRIGVCGMAGINLGPFVEYKSRFFGGSALELFEFCNPNSAVSKSYAEALDVCLRHGVRVTFIGSIDDQVVSLESALHMPLSHPYVCRAVFVDGRLHAPSFLTHLIAFALRLRNLGVTDHGLVREISAPLAGSLVSGEGHSRIYDEHAVYTLAIDFALRSTDAQPLPHTERSVRESNRPMDHGTTAAYRSLSTGVQASAISASSSDRGPSLASSGRSHGIAPVFAPYESPLTAGNSNPFYLPWAVRGVLEEDIVKREMQGEVEALVREFEEWKPSSKVLKDVRFRLEGVRNMH